MSQLAFLGACKLTATFHRSCKVQFVKPGCYKPQPPRRSQPCHTGGHHHLFANPRQMQLLSPWKPETEPGNHVAGCASPILHVLLQPGIAKRHQKRLGWSQQMFVAASSYPHCDPRQGGRTHGEPQMLPPPSPTCQIQLFPSRQRFLCQTARSCFSNPLTQDGGNTGVKIMHLNCMYFLGIHRVQVFWLKNFIYALGFCLN